MKETYHTKRAQKGYSTTTILVIEDDADIGEVLNQTFEMETPFKMILVPDGFQALRIVRTIVPQLILLDYLLPGMDGLECAQQLRTIKSLEQIPIILMSANLPKHLLENSDLITLEKPFELDTLLDLVKRILLEEIEDKTTFSSSSSMGEKPLLLHQPSMQPCPLNKQRRHCQS